MYSTSSSFLLLFPDADGSSVGSVHGLTLEVSCFLKRSCACLRILGGGIGCGGVQWGIDLVLKYLAVVLWVENLLVQQSCQFEVKLEFQMVH